jgi:hypothetical protein
MQGIRYTWVYGITYSFMIKLNIESATKDNWIAQSKRRVHGTRYREVKFNKKTNQCYKESLCSTKGRTHSVIHVHSTAKRLRGKTPRKQQGAGYNTSHKV